MSDELKGRLAYEEYTPTLFDVNQYYDDIGFVGDEKSRLGLTLALVRRKSVGVVSSSGSGKTVMVDALASLLKKNQIYSMEAGSKTAEVYSADIINNAHLIILPEIQKAAASEIVTELLKNLGEGKDYQRKVTKPGGDVETQVIKKGKAIIYTKAIENQYNTDDELDRRFPRFITDDSELQNRNVVNSKATRRTNPISKHKLNDDATLALQYHMSKTLADDANKYVFINPMAEWLGQFIPTTFTVSRSYIDHYLDFIEGAAFFNRKDRIVIDIEVNKEKRKAIIVAPEDAWLTMQVYGEQLLNECLCIPPNGGHIFNCFREAKKKGVKSKANLFQREEDAKLKLTLEQIFNLMKDQGIILKENVIQKILIDLQMSGYLREEVNMNGQKKSVEYYLTSELDNFENNLKWSEGIAEAMRNLQKNFPDVVNDYVAKYCNKSFIDPFTGDLVNVNINITPAAESRDMWLNE